jgi:hypothetical protein
MSMHRRSPGAEATHWLITRPGVARTVFPLTQATHGPKILRIMRTSRDIH